MDEETLDYFRKDFTKISNNFFIMISLKSFVDETICIKSNIDISILSTKSAGFPVIFLSFP